MTSEAGTSPEIPYRWRVTTQSLVVLLTGWKFALSNQKRKHYPDLVNDTSSVWNFCARSSDVILRGNKWWLRNVTSFLRLVHIFLLVSHSIFVPNRTISQNTSWDYSLLYLSDFCHDLHKKLKDWMILLVRVNWNAWLDGDKTFDIVEQPLNPTSNNSRVRMVESCTIPCLWPQQITLQIHYGSLWES